LILLILKPWFDQSALSAHLDALETAAFVNRWQGRMQGDNRKYDAMGERELVDRQARTMTPVSVAAADLA
jgi:hypothetical protein